jgi:predicted small secreted protein
MRRSRQILSSLILAGAVFVAGCSNDVAGPGPDRLDLDAARARWQSQGYRNYSVRMTRLCFCIDVGPFDVTVVGDSVISVKRTADNRVVDYAFVPTVTELFSFIERAINERAATIRVTYDAQLGYPREIVYDGSIQLADEEITYTLTNVTPIVVGAGR